MLWQIVLAVLYKLKADPDKEKHNLFCSLPLQIWGVEALLQDFLILLFLALKGLKLVF